MQCEFRFSENFALGGGVFGLGLDFGSGNLAFRLAGNYYNGRREESGALLTAGFNYRF